MHFSMVFWKAALYPQGQVPSVGIPGTNPDPRGRQLDLWGLSDPTVQTSPYSGNVGWRVGGKGRGLVVSHPWLSAIK